MKSLFQEYKGNLSINNDYLLALTDFSLLLKFKTLDIYLTLSIVLV